MPKRCPVCLTEEYDGRTNVREIYCKRCMENDCATLEFIHERAEKKALENPSKDTQEPR